jgi:hypothetical protein
MRFKRGNSQHYRAPDARGVLVLAIGAEQAYGRIHHRIFRYGFDR